MANRSVFRSFVVSCAIAVLFGCNSSTSSDAVTCSTPGGDVTGPADTHCGGAPVVVDRNICESTNAAGAASGGASSGMDMDMGDYGETLNNLEGDDDECKYHIVWSSSPICKNAPVTFTIKVTAKADGKPVTGAEPEVESFWNMTHPGFTSGQSVEETAPGEYKIGPVKFDTTGKWTVRFHLFPTGCDAPTAPHAHVAFYVNVP